jgi:cellulose synthase/poly-beta-1,6-N-acetylglucosamine synthase-like glycosyltransferase
MIIYADNALDEAVLADNDALVRIYPNTTKYSRILDSLNIAETSGIIYIDNDIKPDNLNLQKFIEGIGNNIDIAWGYIGASINYGFMSRLIAVDKLLSHKIIRPLLWSLNIGISVPGQVFYINKEKFSRDLPQFDTVFDDLTIGICAKQYGYSIVRFPFYLGYEKPSCSLPVLAKQRIRWAKGFYQSLVKNRRSNMLPYVLIHGIMYHFLWLPVWAAVGAVCLFSLPAGLLFWLFLCVCLCGRKWNLTVYALIYSLVFPVFHIIWFIALLFSIAGGIIRDKTKGEFKE